MIDGQQKRWEIEKWLELKSKGTFNTLLFEEQREQVEIDYLAFLLVRIFLKMKEKEDITETERAFD